MTTPRDWLQKQNVILENYKKCADPVGRAYDDLFCQLVWAETATSWPDFLNWVEEFNIPQKRWGFRGQRESAWGLQTSLERALRVETPSGHYYSNRRKAESDLLSKFQQGAHRFNSDLPSNDDIASWRALMQHYGVPTSLLDCTWSPYVALYFAMEEKSSEKNDQDADDIGYSAIWAIDIAWLDGKTPADLGIVSASEHTAHCNNLLSLRDTPLIAKIIPSKDNMRMAHQQGFFLRKQYDKTPYLDQILISMMTHPMQEQPVIRKLKIDKTLRIEILKRLRGMDIHKEYLFPDMEGFCQSLKIDLELELADGTK